MCIILSYVENYSDSNGDLYLKYFLADESFNSRNFALDLSKIRSAIGKRFTKQIDPSLSLFGDGHPWSLKPNASLNDHLDYSRELEDGIIVDISDISANALKSASGRDIFTNKGKFATVKITNTETKNLYLKDPNAIPKAVSIGVLDLLNGKNPHVTDYEVVHLAPVIRGAYGDKATLYGTCTGGLECIDHLKGASIVSSLGTFETQNNNIMSENQNNQGAVSRTNISNSSPPLDTSITSPNVAPVQQTTPAITPQQTTSGVLRLKTSVGPTATNNNAAQLLQQQGKGLQNDPEFLKLKEAQQKLQEQVEFDRKKTEYRQLIPRELFILNGKFDEIGFEKEITKAVEKGWTAEDVQEFYQTKLEILKLGGTIGKPYGASTCSQKKQEYETPSNVPELKGASDSFDSSQFTGIRNLCKMFNLGGH